MLAKRIGGSEMETQTDMETIEGTQREYKILVADDDEFVHALIKVSLRRTTYKLAFVKDGADALELIRTHPPDIVIADGLMPVLSGFELIEDLKSRAETASIPVILLTALDAVGGRAAESAGAKADLRLAKPFKAGTILNCLKRAESLIESNRLKGGRLRVNPADYYVRWRLN
jgi:CheY-like chemotaxis protein